MSSLQDQLKKAGLVKPKAKQPRKKAPKPQKVAKKDRAKVSEQTLRTQQAMIKKAKRDRALNAEREAARKQKELDAQIMQLIDHAKIARPDDEDATDFHFTYKKKVKTLRVTDAQRAQIQAGRAVIVVTPAGLFELIPSQAASKLQERSPKSIIEFTDTTRDETPPEDDPYADYQVPDDLMW